MWLNSQLGVDTADVAEQSPRRIFRAEMAEQSARRKDTAEVAGQSAPSVVYNECGS
jgi:hypothetical protein